MYSYLNNCTSAYQFFLFLSNHQDEKLQLVDEFIQRDICNKLKGDESWHDIEVYLVLFLAMGSVDL